MIKQISTAFLIFALSACTSQDKGEDKKFEPTESLEEAIEKELKKNNTATPAPASKDEVTQKEERPEEKKSDSLSKNIFTLTTLDGKELHIDEADGGITFKEYKDKIVYLLFFGHRCPPCLAEIPALRNITAKNHKDLEIVAVEVQRLPSDKLKAFQRDKRINYTLLSGDEGENSQFISYISQRANWGGSIPFLVVFNKKGEVKVVHVGGMQEEEFNNIYNKLSNEK